KLSCEVVNLYHGGQYQLYKYRRYAPIKLVFAPELQAGFFGGDPDNFTYPRYALDVSFVRAYEADSTTAVRSDHFFRWRAEGAREDELVFVTGNPGSTSRQVPFSEVMYEKVYRHPFLIQLLDGQRQILQQIARSSPQAEQQVRQQLFGIENSLKSYQGQFSGLQDSLLLGRKLKWETEFRQRVNADPKLRSQYGDVWTRLADIQLQKLRTSSRINISNPEFVGAPHIVIAAQLVAYVTEMAKPESRRAEEFSGDQAAQTEQLLKSPVPVDPQLAQSLLALQVAMATRWLEPGDPLLRDLVRPNETAQQAAARLAAGSRVLDAGFRQAVMAGKVAGLDTIRDPIVLLARAMTPVYGELSVKWPEIQAAERMQEERLAKALFAVYGTRLPPDATFTLRITDGIVKGYPYNGTIAPPFTTFYGIYGRSTEFANKDPFTLPKSFEAARSAINLAAPLNFVSTNDITGGNSGSPLIDREGRVVGIAFDGNIESLPNEFVYRKEAGRTVAVHTAGITEALRSIYKAEALLRELTEQAAR
ncbi:MAG: S46 family peptidase, partial [Longimicrobiales bacterium]